ncbi:hypothetical protein ACTIVE_5290 [Actinomadura verrucosospora]|uniref:Uncharacterized protein n=1 Tax=Actinomadura verrucosospora TaxID=46165 RepID=A0A7D4A876_ACTVE|nr:hypothetical protein ACTIVE_5290 [Actinomadura verrucosospora]
MGADVLAELWSTPEELAQADKTVFGE